MVEGTGRTFWVTKCKGCHFCVKDVKVGKWKSENINLKMTFLVNFEQSFLRVSSTGTAVYLNEYQVSFSVKGCSLWMEIEISPTCCSLKNQLSLSAEKVILQEDAEYIYDALHDLVPFVWFKKTWIKSMEECNFVVQMVPNRANHVKCWIWMFIRCVVGTQIIYIWWGRFIELYESQNTFEIIFDTRLVVRKNNIKYVSTRLV